MLGSLSEAEDAVQEAWLRLEPRRRRASVANLGGWLTTVVGAGLPRHAARAQVAARGFAGREALAARAGRRAPGAGDPSSEAELADSVGLALLVVLETLTPAERVAFVLHDMFDLCLRGDRSDRRPLAGWRHASSRAGRAAACRAGPPRPSPT